MQNSLVCYPILRFGDEAQKRKFLPRLTRDKQLGCYAFAEPSAGSDAGAIQTTATADGDAFVLNGQKAVRDQRPRRRTSPLCTRLPIASRGRDGLSAFIVEKDTPGIVGRRRGRRSWVFTPQRRWRSRLSDCRVPKANLLGGLNRGFEIARAVVESGRIDIAAQAVGIAQACLDKSVAHAKERRQFGRPIAEFEAIQWMLADMSHRDRSRTAADVSRRDPPRAASARCARSRCSRRWRSCTPPRRPIARRTAPCRCSAATAICRSFRWSATSATPGR